MAESPVETGRCNGFIKMAHPQKVASLHTSGMNTMPGWIRASFSCSKHLQGRVPIENHSGLAAWKRWGNVRRQTLSKKHGLPLPWVGPPRIHFTPSAAYKGAVDNCEWLILPFLVFNLLSVRAPPSCGVAIDVIVSKAGRHRPQRLPTLGADLWPSTSVLICEFSSLRAEML